MNSVIRKTGAIPELKGKSKPYVIAHRGNQTACPENTLAAWWPKRWPVRRWKVGA